MKPNFNFNKLIFSGALLAMIVFFATSCVKDYRDGETRFTGLQPSVLIPEGGLSSNTFGGAALTFPPDPADTAFFHVNYAATGVAPADETVTLGIDQQAVTDYNGTGGIQYELMPDSLYSFTTTQVTVKAGNNYTDAIPLVVYPGKIDPTKSYMLPITITAGPSGAIISSDQKTIYYHVIGNPLAGNYLWSFYRWNDVPDTTGPPNSTVFEDQPVTIAPIDATTLLLPEGYLNANVLGLGGVSLGFTNTNGVISDPFLSIDPVTQKAITDGGFKVVTAPTLISYQIVGNASTHYTGTYFRFYFEILNSTGGNRKTINVFTKQ